MSHTTIVRALLGLFLLACVSPVFAQVVTPPEAKLKVWEYAEYWVVPVRVHLLRETVTTAAGTTLANSDIARIFRKANGIWHAAGVHLRVESIVSEKPATRGENEHKTEMPIEALLALRPAETRQEGMFHVYYLGAMSPNGIYMRRDGIFVKETAKLRPVEGGIDEPLPRVSAHELGHAMGLPHRQDRTNLLASGTTGTSLNEVEIEIVRQTVSRLKWVETPETCLKTADAMLTIGKKEEALSRYRALLELSGDDKAKAALRTKIEHATASAGAEGHGRETKSDAKP